jgi:hypothetical protein
MAPFWLIYVLAIFFDLFCFLLSPFISWQPTFTRELVLSMNWSLAYTNERSVRILKYTPQLSYQEAMKKTRDYFRNATWID